MAENQVKMNFPVVAAVLKQPWMLFLILALAMQQINLLTYRFGAHNAVPYVFMVYSFAAQAFTSFIMMLFLKNRGFPVLAFSRKMKLLLLAMIFIYMMNELTLVYVYSLGAPYALMMAVFAVVMLVIMVVVALIFLGERLNRRKALGIFLAIISIILIRLG